MPLRIIRNDITKVKADAIVNTANPEAKVGGGTDSAIYKAAGEKELLVERKNIGTIKVGMCVYTDAYKLKAKYIIHTVGPYWIDGKHGEEELLRKCYSNCLELAKELKCKSIAFPMISTGVYKFPKAKALNIATSTINEFLLENDMKVLLVVFDNEAFKLSGKLYENIEAYIDDNYVDDYHDAEYERALNNEIARDMQRRNQALSHMAKINEKNGKPDFDKQKFKPDKTFQEKLMEYVNSSGLKRKDIYEEIGMTKQHFSKIANDKYYQPGKDTALALCVILKLNYEDSADLLSRAGFSFSKSSKRDLVIEYALKNGINDFSEIHDNLVARNLPGLYLS